MLDSSLGLVITIVATAIVGGLALIAITLGAMLALYAILARAGGLDALVERYPVHGPSPEERLRRQHLMIGPVRYRWSADVAIADRGLYLRVQPPLARPKAALVPWSALGEPQEITLYWRKAVRLAVGDPPVARVAFMAPLYQAMRPYLEGRGTS
jgi:hypothetical protein